jgi:hypothetical protein
VVHTLLCDQPPSPQKRNPQLQQSIGESEDILRKVTVFRNNVNHLYCKAMQAFCSHTVVFV